MRLHPTDHGGDMALAALQRAARQLRLARKRHQAIALGNPVLARPTGVCGQHQLHRHPGGGAQRAEQPVDRRRVGILPGLLHPGIGEVAALILLGIVDTVEISEGNPPAIRHAPAPFAFIILGAERLIDLPGALDGIFRGDGGAAEHDGVEVGSVTPFLQGPFAEHAIGLAATARAAEEHLGVQGNPPAPFAGPPAGARR